MNAKMQSAMDALNAKLDVATDAMIAALLAEHGSIRTGELMAEARTFRHDMQGLIP
jgi:hypothetical protein